MKLANVAVSLLSLLTIMAKAEGLIPVASCFQKDKPYKGITTVNTECLDEFSEQGAAPSKKAVQLQRKDDQYYLEIEEVLHRAWVEKGSKPLTHNFYVYRTIKIPVRISTTWFGADLLASAYSKNSGYSQSDGSKYTSTFIIPGNENQPYHVQDLFSSFEGSYKGLGGLFIGFANGGARSSNGLKIKDMMFTLFGIPGSNLMFGGAWYRYSLLIEASGALAEISYWSYDRQALFCQQQTGNCKIKNLSRQVPSYSLMREKI